MCCASFWLLLHTLVKLSIRHTILKLKHLWNILQHNKYRHLTASCQSLHAQQGVFTQKYILIFISKRLQVYLHSLQHWMCWCFVHTPLIPTLPSYGRTVPLQKEISAYKAFGKVHWVAFVVHCAVMVHTMIRKSELLSSLHGRVADFQQKNVLIPVGSRRKVDPSVVKSCWN